jgi:hypothetical protein
MQANFLAPNFHIYIYMVLKSDERKINKNIGWLEYVHINKLDNNRVGDTTNPNTPPRPPPQ